MRSLRPLALATCLLLPAILPGQSAKPAPMLDALKTEMARSL